MKNRLYFSFVLLMLSFFSSAQDFLPFASSNYAGITGVQLQPASIADSRYKFDLALSSTSISVYNNFFGIDPYVLTHPTAVGSGSFNQYVTRNFDGAPKKGIFSVKQDFFSFMITLSDKDAIAFTPSVRGIANFDNITDNLAQLIDSSLILHSLWNKTLNNDNFSVQANTWVEYGFTYARVILDKEKHFLKAGITAKITQGIGSAYVFGKDLSYKLTNNDTLSLYNSKVSYGLSDNITDELDNIKYKFDANPSISFDLGVVYEYRPDWMEYKYDMDGKTNIWAKDEDKYLFRIGFSITDLGNVRFRRNPLSNDFDANASDLPIGNWDIGTIADADSIINHYFDQTGLGSKYNMNLPTVLSMQADVRVAKGFYINVTPYLALKQGNKDVNKVHYISALNVVPRFDRARFGISFPVQYNAYKQWNMGLGLRIGALWIGSNDLFSTFVSDKNRYGTSLSAVIKVPILYHQPGDRDNDKVSDKRDKCPKVPGTWEMRGCPDTDLDGITDELDHCPNMAGPKETSGCPDKDGDGILDKDDQCPDVKGLALFNGCPDSDGDSIIDQNDACPFNAGLINMNGCPDQDADGIADTDDNCPTVAGTRENKGCPYLDGDGDGITDDSDNCPGVKGPMENQGCPYQDTDNDSIPDKDDECPSMAGLAIFKGCPDTDNDGISDKTDLCPTLPGVAQNNGCPEIKKEEKEILKRAFNNLEFETGKAIIRKSSYNSLGELAEVLKKRSEFKLLLSGHTDNAGSPESNLVLSKNRTQSVKNYLVQNGIDPDRIKTEWFGQAKPIASNSTPEGRQQNRRVEMNIIFE